MSGLPIISKPVTPTGSPSNHPVHQASPLKRQLESSSDEWTPDKIASLTGELEKQKHELKATRKKIKGPRLSHDSDYWTLCADSAAMEKKLINDELRLETGKASVEGSELSWSESPRKRELSTLSGAFHEKEKILRRHAERLLEEKAEPGAALKRSYLELLMNAKMGMDLAQKQYGGARDSQAQKNFKISIVERYGLAPTPEELQADPFLDSDSRWDIALGRFRGRREFIASHIVPARTGIPTMDAIFGEGSGSELFSSLNGVLFSSAIEKELDRGLFVIVPDLPKDAGEEEVAQWQASAPKEYVFKILKNLYYDEESRPSSIQKDHEARLNKTIDLEMRKKLRDLDGQRLKWRNEHRPRSRYLFYLFIVNVLTFIFNNREEGVASVVLHKHLGKPYWGTPEKYVRVSMLRSLIKEIGYDIGQFLLPETDQPDQAQDDDDDEGKLLTAAVLSDIIGKPSVDEDEDDEDEDDEHEDDEHEDDEDEDEENEWL